MNKGTANLLEQYFDTAFAAPNGIQKLRELILTLAMQGKLVPQDPSDPPVSELLKEIETEKKRLVKEGKIKTLKPLPPVAEEEKPYALPQGWEWTRLGVLAIVNGGFAFKSSKYSDEGVRVIRISDFDENGFKDDKIVRHPYSNDLIGFSLEPNNILMAMTGGTVGKSLLVKKIPELMVVNQRVATIKIFEKVAPEFINALIRTDLIQSVIHAAKNSTNDNISMTDITGFLVPLPSLPEQHRIVAKIDELMARCDELEKLRTTQNEKRLTVHAAAMGQLLNIAEPAQHQRAQAFLADHFSDLYTVKAHIAELRKAILQLAVMGKLLPQNPNDAPASELLKDIETEKKRLVKAGKIKAPKPLPMVTDVGKPFELPEGWEWVLFQALPTEYSVGLDRGRTQQSTESDGKFRYFKMNNILNDGGFDLTDVVYVEASGEEVERFSLNDGDLLFNTRNSRELVGKTCVFKGDSNGPVLYNNNILRAIFTDRAISEFIDLWLGSTSGKAELEKIKSGTTNVWAIYQGKLEQLLCPVPPLAEQSRIVAKVEELMARCNELDKLRASVIRKQTELLYAVIAQL